jgi:twitching motility protein PilI
MGCRDAGPERLQLTRSITRDPRFVDVPVIMCTSKNQETDKVWGMRQGARDYIVKPVDADELVSKIRRSTDAARAAQPRPGHTERWPTRKHCVNSRVASPSGCRRRARRIAASRGSRSSAARAASCFPLKEAGEIFPLSPIVPVPASHAWFLGVANLRGHLHGVVDLAGFLGVKGSEPLREQSRLVAFNAALDINCALLVDRCRACAASETDRRADDGSGRARFAGARYATHGARLAGAEPGRAGGDERFPEHRRLRRRRCAGPSTRDERGTMSFLNKIKGWGEGRRRRCRRRDDAPFDDAYASRRAPSRRAAADAAPLDVPTLQQTHGGDSRSSPRRAVRDAPTSPRPASRSDGRAARQRPAADRHRPSRSSSASSSVMVGSACSA